MAPAVAASRAIWRFETTHRVRLDAATAVRAQVGMATSRRAARATKVACSVGTARRAALVIQTPSTTVRLAVRPIGAATATSIRMVTWITSSAYARTANAAASKFRSVRIADAITAVAALLRAARAARSAAAALRATRTTTSIRVRRSLRRLTRITRSAAHAITCWVTRRALVDIDCDLGGKAEGGNGTRFWFHPPASFLS